MAKVDELPVTKAPEGTGSFLTFYNPGKAINEIFQYDHPVRVKGDPREVQPALMQIRMPERGFVEVPTSILVVSEELGIENMAVIEGLYTRFMNLYRGRGVVLVEAKPHKTREDDDHVAPTKEAAVKLGDDFYRKFLRDLVSDWYTKVEQVKAAGGVPRSAQGLYLTALKETGHADPADRIDIIEGERKNSASSSDLQQQINELKLLLMQKATA